MRESIDQELAKKEAMIQEQSKKINTFMTELSAKADEKLESLEKT